ncbi:lysophospholipase II [Exophiala viscosa]|uniref:Lysophospholipase II n=1 Tax=Exophiala viscosa TaxID=2486360 RepID=A0AAN6IF12_9EURO|nr:lysophospholipase II [Exophiala viscosa]KAI1621240.1 lysophospholipase II [Exophiala viscosa]
MHVVSRQATSKHTHTVIFLHGRDSTAQEFADEFFESEATEPAEQPRTLPDLFPGIKWVFPAAPLLHSKRFDTTMSQWFDIWSVEELEDQEEIQPEGLKQSIGGLVDVIRAEETLVPRQNIFLGGISQGFAVALSTFFAVSHNFAGLIGLCSWMPLASIVDNLKASSNTSDEEQLLRAVHKTYFGQQSQGQLSWQLLRSTPIFLGHAIDDCIVPVKNGRKMRDTLVHSLQMDARLYEYEDGGHWINEPQGVDDIVQFLNQNMLRTRNTMKESFKESLGQDEVCSANLPL